MSSAESFNMGFEERLIEKIKAAPFLYDTTDSFYRNKRKKYRAWREISIGLRVDEIRCRKKWKSLRDQYMREVRKQMATKTNSVQHGSQTQWKFFDHLHFLKDSFKPRQFKYDSPFEDDEEDATRGTSFPKLKVEIEKPLLHHQDSTGHQYEEANNSMSCASPQSVHNSDKIPEKQITESFHTILESVLSKMQEKEDDPTEIFFKSIAKTVKTFKLSNCNFIDLQCKILNLIRDECKKYE